MALFISSILVITGIVHLLPLSGVYSTAQLASLYAIRIESPDVEILMRHRAVLFGLLGSFLIYSAFEPRMQMLGLLAALISTISFVVISWNVGQFNGAIARVVYIDLALTIALSVAMVGKLLNQ